MIYIGKHYLRGTYIYFPDVQTFIFESDYHNLTIAGHFLDLIIISTIFGTLLYEPFYFY